MQISNSSLNHVAISYDTATFNDLKCYLRELNINLHRIDPQEFMDADILIDQYINLVVQDFSLREKITNKLNYNNLARFSYIHPTASIITEHIALGAFIYPFVMLLSNIIIGHDVIIQGTTGIAHNVLLDEGTYISGGVTIGGSTQIGKFCFIGIGSLIYDNVKISDNVVVGGSSVIKKNLLQSGTYASLHNKIKKLK